MQNITDELLIEAYFQAIKLKLDPNFIHLLKTEIQKRSLLTNLKVPS